MLPLPRCVYEKHGAFYYVKRGKWHFLTKDRNEILKQLELQFGIANGDVKYGNNAAKTKPLLKLHLATSLTRAKQNAKGRGKEFNITLDSIYDLLDECGGRCAVTGAPFSLDFISRDGRRPFAPSIDRINSAIGYVPGNVRLVCLAANLAMNTWGEDVLQTMLRYSRKRQSIRHASNSIRQQIGHSKLSD